MKRPLFYLTLFYILGIIICAKLCTYFLWGFLIIGLVLLFKVRKNKKYIVYILMFCLAFTFGYLHYNYKSNINKSSLANFEKQQVMIAGTCLDTTKKDNKQIIIMEAHVLNNKSIDSERVRVERYSEGILPTYNYGDLIKVYGKVVLPEGIRNPGGFDYRRYLLTKNIYSIVKANNVSQTGESKDYNIRFIRWCMQVKGNMINVIEKVLPKEQALLLQALVLSKTDVLDEEIKNNFSDSGLSHIMAVSGMNVALIVVPMIYILKKIRLKDGIAAIIISLALIIFAIITGASSSVVRAVIMSLIVLYGKLLNRDSDILTTIAFSALLMLLFNPVLIYDVGFQLSYCATLSIIVLFDMIKNLFKFLPNWFNDLISVSLSAQIGVVPIIAYYFNKISLISLFSNIIAVPVSEILLIMGLSMTILGQISILLAKALSGLNYILLIVLSTIAKKSANLPFASLTITTPTIFEIATYYGAIGSILLFYNNREKINSIAVDLYAYFNQHIVSHLQRINKKAISAAGLSIGIIVIGFNLLHTNPLEISYIDVGQADCAYIRTPGNKNVLFDCGSGSRQEFNNNESTIVPFLLDKRVRRIDIIILSHTDFDHVSAFKSITEKFKVKRLIASNAVVNDNTWKQIYSIAKEKDIKIINLNSGNIKIDKNLNIETYCTTKAESTNDESLVVKMTYKRSRFLFPGDISKEGESCLLDNNVSSDVLEIPHHGSKYSSSMNFLDKISPKVAVISVGDNNYGHPSAEVIDRLEQKGISIFRTDKQGCITILSDGDSIKVKTMNGENTKYEL